IIYASQSVKKILGFKPSELIGKSILHYIDGKHKTFIKNKIRSGTTKDNEIAMIEIKLKHKDGSWRYLESVGRNLLNDPIIKGIVVNSRDVTKRKKAQDELKRSEFKYKSVIQQSHAAIYMLDPKSMVLVEANATFFAYTGYSKKHLDKLTVFDIVDAPKTSIQNFVGNVMKNGRYEIGERTWLHKNGQKVHVIVSASRIQQNGKNLIVVLAHNITLLKKTEEQLKAKNSELDTFVYRASHDLRSPIASIQGLVHLALKEVKDKAALKYFDLIGTAIAKQDEILEDLTQVTIIRQGEVELKSFKPKPFIEEIVRSFKEHAIFQRAKFQIKDNTTKNIISDERLLKTILRNLIENALKYRKSKSQNSFVNISIAQGADNVKITIEDNGMGIPEKYQEKIYDMFFRATQLKSGTGLGLYIVKSALEKLDGSIKVESKEKVGTTFTLNIPNN
ncbi:MAG: hypothetical protein COB85_03645, partial [Bacteroidetes bacterium]